MLIYVDSNKIQHEVVDVAVVTADNRVIMLSELYATDTLLWESIRSCFSKGFWSEEKPWIECEGWKEL